MRASPPSALPDRGGEAQVKTFASCTADSDFLHGALAALIAKGCGCFGAGGDEQVDIVWLSCFIEAKTRE